MNAQTTMPSLSLASRLSGPGPAVLWPRSEFFQAAVSCPAYFGDTDEDARRRAQAVVDLRFTPEYREIQLWFPDHLTGLDFGHYDLDMPCEEIVAEFRANKGGVNVGTTDSLFKGGEQKTLGDMLSSRGLEVDLGLIGSPDTEAAKMDEPMQEVGGDGFLSTTPTNRRAIAEVAHGFAPALRRRGLIRDSYAGKTFRDNLLAF